MSEDLSQSSARKYEGLVIVHPDASEEEQKAFFKKNKEIISSFSGEINHVDTWGKRKLANPINKLTRGIYFHVTFSAKGNCVAELERTMRINDKVLRFTHMRLDDRVSLPKFVEDFKNSLAEAVAREKEREAKFQLRKAQGGGPGGPRREGGRDEGREGGGFRREGREDGGGSRREGGGRDDGGRGRF